ncbi:MAG TPA: hypothetical protein VHG28_03160 [Longimicrobiaceae bacterium]|nr:hypothetical protein [Longimicrobiaceae bacterium]
MKEFVERHTLRDAETITGVTHEAIRKFIEGETERPHPRSLRAFTVLYWRERGLVFLAEAGGSEPPVFWASELRALFPGGREQAVADVRKVFELAERFPDEIPGTAAAMSRWWMRLIEAEYRNELPYPRPHRRGPGGERGEGGGAK